MPDQAHEAVSPQSVEALIAGTVALMTVWADPCPHCTLDPAVQRSVLAQKVVSNLFILSHHGGLSEGLRLVMGKAHERWVGLVQPSDAHDGADPGRAPAPALH